MQENGRDGKYAGSIRCGKEKHHAGIFGGHGLVDGLRRRDGPAAAGPGASGGRNPHPGDRDQRLHAGFGGFSGGLSAAGGGDGYSAGAGSRRYGFWRAAPDWHNDRAEDAIALYRRLLAAAETPLEIIEIGYPQVLAGVLGSPADALSPLGGLELVRQKVKKCWVMAGKWDENPGRENNFARNERSRRSGAALCRLCPVPITFLGWEAGASVITGNELEPGDALAQALRDHGSGNGRSSWDPMLALLALTGDEITAGYDTVRGRASVDPETGCNHFTQAPDGPHCFVVKNRPDGFYQRAINEKIKTMRK